MSFTCSRAVSMETGTPFFISFAAMLSGVFTRLSMWWIGLRA